MRRWEERDKASAVIGRGRAGGLALSLKRGRPMSCYAPKTVSTTSRHAAELATKASRSLASIARSNMTQECAPCFHRRRKSPCTPSFSRGKEPEVRYGSALGCEINRQGIVKTGISVKACRSLRIASLRDFIRDRRRSRARRTPSPQHGAPGRDGLAVPRKASWPIGHDSSAPP